MTTVGIPIIDDRAEQAYMGIRTVTPFSGMFKVITKISKDMTRWMKNYSSAIAGPPFLRYNVIDMSGPMDITFGFPVNQILPEDGLVTAGILPAGRFASLIYIGNGYTGNKTLIEWAGSNGLEFDRWDTPQGDNFRCRYEKFLTDPKLEPRKTRWEIEVAIKLLQR